MFQSLHLCSKLSAVQLCRNATFSELFETAYGLIIINKLEAGIDPYNKSVSPVSTMQKSCGVQEDVGIYDAQ